MSRHLAALVAFLALGLAACSPRPVVIRAVPDDAASLRLYYNLVGGLDVPPEHIYFTLDGRLAVEDLPPSATRVTSIPLLAAEARSADGCLLASATTQGWELTLRPIVDCGRVAPTPPAPPAQTVVDIKPQPPKDTDGDGVLDDVGRRRPSCRRAARPGARRRSCRWRCCCRRASGRRVRSSRAPGTRGSRRSGREVVAESSRRLHAAQIPHYEYTKDVM